MGNVLKLFRMRFGLSILIFLTVIFFITSGIHATGNPKTIQITTIDYPPLLGSKSGLITEIVTEAFKSKEITVEYKIYPMARIVWSVTEGSKVVAAVGSRDWFHKADVAENVHFVSIYFTGLIFFSLKEKFPHGVEYDKLEDLKKYEIGYVRGGSLIPIFKKANLNLQLVATISQNVLKLHKGRVDMFAATELGGWAVIRKYYPEEVNKFSVSDKFIHHINGDIIFAKNQEALTDIFNQGLEIIKNNGSYLNILKKYYADREIPKRLLEFIKSE